MSKGPWPAAMRSSAGWVPPGLGAVLCIGALRRQWGCTKHRSKQHRDFERNCERVFEGVLEGSAEPSAANLRNIVAAADKLAKQREHKKPDDPDLPASLERPEPERPPRDEDADRLGVQYEERLVARLKLLPKKGDLSLCKNWRGICLLDIVSKILSSVMVSRMQQVQEAYGLEAQCGFRGVRGTIDGLFNTTIALQKRREHNLETWALFIDLVKAFDTVSREALFLVLRKFGMPDHFINIVIRLHQGASIAFKVGETDTNVPSTIGVRQGSCEGPTPYQHLT